MCLRPPPLQRAATQRQFSQAAHRTPMARSRPSRSRVCGPASPSAWPSRAARSPDATCSVVVDCTNLLSMMTLLNEAARPPEIRDDQPLLTKNARLERNRSVAVPLPKCTAGLTLSDLFSGVLGFAPAAKTFLDVLVLAVALRAPCLLGHLDHSVRIVWVTVRYPPLAALSRGRSSDDALQFVQGLANREGRLIVDAAGVHSDPATTRPTVPLCSTTVSTQFSPVSTAERASAAVVGREYLAACR